MRIGMVSIWFHRGQSEVTKTLRQALIDNGHEVFIFGRMGAVYGQNMQEKDDPYWKLPNVYCFPKYEIPPAAITMWAKVNKLDMVVFNEEYDFNLPMCMQAIGVKTIHYVDFIRDDWASLLRTCYNQLWSATKRTTALLDDLGLADITKYIGWGIPDNMTYRGDEAPHYDFFHNAGWLGINFRKGTDLVIRALSKIFSDGHWQVSLIHAQVPIDVLPEDLYSMAKHLEINGRLIWTNETTPPPGLYHLGRVVVQPSRMEGLGLTIPEAMWQGRAVITTDAPPMNEFIVNNVHLVPYTEKVQRSDGLSFPECTADIGQLTDNMRHELTSGHYVEDGDRNRVRALEILDWTSFRGRIAAGMRRLGA